MRALMNWLLLSASMLLAAGTQAEVFQGEEIEVELVAETANAVPGETFWVAVRLDPTEGWHTYSRWPGDSGDPTFIHEWTLPEGAEAGEIHWPVPEWLPFPGTDLVTFSYKDEVLLMVPVEVPSSYAQDTFPVSAHVEWQVCDQICLIGDAEVGLEVPVGDTLEPEPAWADAFADTRANWPEQEHDVDALFARAGERISFSFTSDDGTLSDIDQAWFFPESRRIIQPGPLRDVSVMPAGVQITHNQHRRILEDLDGVAGLLKVEYGDGSVRGFDLEASLATDETLSAVASAAGSQDAGDPGQSLLLIMLFALMGGAMLNLMPCVFPVLSLKALSLVSKSHQEMSDRRLHGMAYTAGIVLAFMVLASVLLVLRAGGEAVGWAFQLQSPWFVALLVYLFFLMGLSLSGVYQIGGRLAGVGQSLTEKTGYRGSFFTGVLATVVASPCTAPFMGAALGFALSQSWLVAMLVFGFLGLGMALPFLALTFVPALMRYMPSPGPWMETFKEFMAFPLYATALWLLWVLGLQVGVNGLIAVAGSALFLAFALWLLQHRKTAAGPVVRYASVVVPMLILIGALAVLRMPVVQTNTGGVMADGRQPGTAAEFEPFSSARVEELREQGTPVFVNMTAAWCITCLANENTTLNTDRVRQSLEDNGIVYMKGDWTNRDPEISRVLDEFNRPSVPLYILYPGDPSEEPQILPQILTPGIVTEAFAAL
ncbi:MAG: protein-disulfide reductase DsbD domain-containing protein [Pseudohongiellaceae bacterium]